MRSRNVAGIRSAVLDDCDRGGTDVREKRRSFTITADLSSVAALRWHVKRNLQDRRSRKVARDSGTIPRGAAGRLRRGHFYVYPTYRPLTRNRYTLRAALWLRRSGQLVELRSFFSRLQGSPLTQARTSSSDSSEFDKPALDNRHRVMQRALQITATTSAVFPPVRRNSTPQRGPMTYT
jgi:hypothetical protein